MHFLKTLGLKTYYSVRRIGKALRNWRKFGVIIFGSLFVASTFMPFSISADDLRVEITKNNLNLSSLSVDMGDVVQFSAKAFLGVQEITSDTSFVWSTNGLFKSTDVGFITQSGLYTAGETADFYSGAIRLVGTYDGKSDLDTVSVTINSVTPPSPVITLDRVEILDTNNLALSSFSIDEGNSKQFKTKAYDVNGNDITSQTSFVWSVNGIAGTVTSNGYFTASNNAGFYSGAINLTGTYNDKSDVDTVSVLINEVTPVRNLTYVIINPASTVLDANTTQQFSAKAYDQNNRLIIDGVNYSWSIVNGGGTINYASGLFTAGNIDGAFNNTVRVRASMSDNIHYDYATVTVRETIPVITLSYVEVIPSSVVLDQGSSYQFNARAYDQNNNLIISGVSYTWAVVNSGGIINSAGVFKAGSVDGTFSNTVRVSASIEDNMVYDYATVIINPIFIQATLDRVEILPSSITLNTNQSFDFDAQAYDANNSPMFSNIDYTWSVVSGYGSINQNGLFEASDITGTAIIQAEASSGSLHRFDTATVTITGGIINNDVLSYVIITPQIVHLDPGQSVDFDAQAYNGSGFPISASYTWSAINSSAGFISSSGYLSAGYTVGSYYNSIRVKAYKNGVEKSDYADVIIRLVTDQNYYLNANLSAVDENGGTVRPSDIILYTLTLTNNQNRRLTNVRTTLDLPEYTTFISVTSNDGSPGINGRNIVWNIANLNDGEINTLNLRVRINQNISANRIISAKAFASANELDNGFWVWANNLQVEGGIDIPDQPLTPTGAMSWILIAITALLATILTRQMLYAKQLIRN